MPLIPLHLSLWSAERPSFGVPCLGHDAAAGLLAVSNASNTYRLRRDADGNLPAAVTRPCLRYRLPFESEGARHRLCLPCTNKAEEVNPYAV